MGQAVRIYGYRGCKFCETLLRELEERKVPYEYVDIFKRGQPLWAGVFPAVEVCSYREQGYDGTLADRLAKLSRMNCEEIDTLTRKRALP